MNPPRYAATPRRLDWPSIILAELVKLAASRSPLPTHDDMCAAFGVERSELQRHMRILEMRGQIRVLRGIRNERIAIYATDGSWRLERPGGENQPATMRRCNNCGELFKRPSRYRFQCDPCNERPWRAWDVCEGRPHAR